MVAQSKVPCNGCTLCCHNDAIRMLPGDDITLYQTVPHERYPGHQMLDHKENGDCIYLGETGCTIHGRKPVMCGELDCRQLAKQFDKKWAVKNGIIKVWKRGRQLSGRSW